MSYIGDMAENAIKIKNNEMKGYGIYIYIYI